METEIAEKQSSYRYWVRETREDAAPLPVPKRLSEDDLSKQPQPAALGSVWNQPADGTGEYSPVFRPPQSGSSDFSYHNGDGNEKKRRKFRRC